MKMKSHPDYNNLLQFDSLNKYSAIKHFCTTRTGGVSKGAFSSFNLGNFSDDNPMDIFENRQNLARMWYMDLSDFIIPHQTHSSNVLSIDQTFLQLNPSDKIDALYDIDATITELSGVFLCATTADCVPVLLFDHKRKIIAAIHAGWKGIVNGIIEKTISKMQETYQSNPLDIVAAIGPSISIKNYEIGDDVTDLFKTAGFDLSNSSFHNNNTNKLHIDLKLIVNNELKRLGVPSNQVESSTLCTFDSDELFFSARRQSLHCGRMLTGIKLID